MSFLGWLSLGELLNREESADGDSASHWNRVVRPRACRGKWCYFCTNQIEVSIDAVAFSLSENEETALDRRSNYFVRCVSVVLLVPYVLNCLSVCPLPFLWERNISSVSLFCTLALLFSLSRDWNTVDCSQHQKHTVRKTANVVISHIMSTGKRRYFSLMVKTRIDKVKDSIKEKISKVKHGFRLGEFRAWRKDDISVSVLVRIFHKFPRVWKQYCM